MTLIDLFAFQMTKKRKFLSKIRVKLDFFSKTTIFSSTSRQSQIIISASSNINNQLIDSSLHIENEKQISISTLTKIDDQVVNSSLDVNSSRHEKEDSLFVNQFISINIEETDENNQKEITKNDQKEITKEKSQKIHQNSKKFKKKLFLKDLHSKTKKKI